MSAPRQSLNKATLSVGYHAKLVTVKSVIGDGAWALTVDRQNTETRVPMFVQRSKGPLPAAGETWLLDQELGYWTFSAFIGSSPAEFLPEVGGGVPEISVSATAPASPSKNALWINTSAGDELLQWNGSQWQPLLIGTQAIADQAVTGQKIADGTITALQIAPDAGITSGQVSFTVSELGGIPISVGASQPQNPVVGEVWFDPTNGNAMKTWNGSQWVGYQFGTGAIAAGSITAEQIAAGAIIAEKIAAGSITAGALAAGIVVAGIVNGTTIEGAQIVADGTQGELLVYSGVPGPGNLIASISGSGGTDSSGNPYLGGPVDGAVVSYSPGISAVSLSGSTVQFWNYSSGWQLSAAMYSDGYGNLWLTPLSGKAVVASGPVQIIEPLSAPEVPETWHPLTLGAGWSAYSGIPSYRMNNDGDIDIYADLSVPASPNGTTVASLDISAGGGVLGGTIVYPYYVQHYQSLEAIVITSSGSASATTPRVYTGGGNSTAMTLTAENFPSGVSRVVIRGTLYTTV